MSRSSDERFSDILAAIERCLEYRSYLDAEEAPLAGMAMDAVLRNLAVIGEAVRMLPDDALMSLADVRGLRSPDSGTSSCTSTSASSRR